MDQETDENGPPVGGEQTDAPLPTWLRASVSDLANLDFEVPIDGSKSADIREIGDLFRTAAGETSDSPAARVFRMLSAVAGMSFKPKERNEPFGPMVVFQDGSRSPIPSDFQGAPTEVLVFAAERADNFVLKARLADLCWVLDIKKGKLASAAVAAYVDVVTRVDNGSLEFPFDKGQGALKHDARNLLRRALQIGRAVGWDKPEAVAARAMVAKLRVRALKNKLPVPALWFSDLDLDFGISDPATVGKGIEDLINDLPDETDERSIVELWRITARAYHFAKSDEDKYRARSAAAEQFVVMAERQSMAMMASSLFSESCATV